MFDAQSQFFRFFPANLSEALTRVERKEEQRTFSKSEIFFSLMLLLLLPLLLLYIACKNNCSQIDSRSSSPTTSAVATLGHGRHTTTPTPTTTCCCRIRRRCFTSFISQKVFFFDMTCKNFFLSIIFSLHKFLWLVVVVEAA